MSVIVRNKRARRFPANAIIVDTTSKSADEWSRGLSPFFVGPVDIVVTDRLSVRSENVENAWQYAKVYADNIGVDGEPNDKYWAWATQGWKRKDAVRYPRGRGATPLYSLWGGKHLGYIAARKQIYCPLYAEAVVQTAAFARLSEIYEQCRREGRVLVLLDYDGYDSHGASYSEILHNPAKKCGHAFVLAMLLEGVSPWRNDRENN